MLKQTRVQLKTIGKYSILLLIKESYLFSRNLLGLFVHPFKTLRVIFKEKDYSQVILIFGFPFYILIFGLLSIILARFLIQAPSAWGLAAKFLLALLLFFSLAIFSYLSYWFYKLKKVKDLK